LLALIMLVSGLLYLPVMQGAPVWDDAGFISGKTIGGGESLLKCFTEPFNLSYYRPFVSASFFLDRHLFGNTPFVYHLTNALIHVATVAVIFAAVVALFRDRGLALLAALLFGVQPVQVSTVAWIGGRTDSLCALFVSLFALGLVRWHRTEGVRWPWIVLAATAFFSAAMTKEQAVALLPLAPLSALCFAPRRERWRNAAWLGFGFAGVAAAFVALWFLNYPNPLEATKMAASDRVTAFLHSTVHYALLFVAPTPTRMHMFSLANHDGSAALWSLAGAATLALLVFLGVRLARRSPEAFWFLALALLGFLPVSNLVAMPSLIVAPYRVGIAGIGVAVAVAWGITRLWAALADRRVPRALLAAGVTGYAMAMAGLVAWGSKQWLSDETTFSAIVRHDPGSLVGRSNLVTTLGSKRRWPEMRQEAAKTLDLVFQGRDWSDLSHVPTLLAKRPDVRAFVTRNQGNRIRPEQTVGRLLFLYGHACENEDDTRRAHLAYHAAERIDPKNAEAIAGVAWLVFPVDPAGAEARLRRAVKLGGKRVPRAAQKMGDLEEARGNLRAALAYYRIAAEGTPWLGEVHLRIGTVLARLGDAEGAQLAFRRAEQGAVDEDRLEAARRTYRLSRA